MVIHDDTSVSNAASDTLDGLARFLAYVEFPASAEQVRNIREILQGIMVIEQQEKCLADETRN
jgi:hypothetical protein